MVAPRAFVPQPVVADALVDLLKEPLRAVAGVRRELLVAQSDAYQAVRARVPAADVVDAPLVRVDVLRRGQQHLVRDEPDLVLGESVVDAVESLRHWDEPARLVERLRAYASAAARGLAAHVVKRILEVPLRVARENLLALCRVSTVAGQRVHKAEIADGSRQRRVLAAEDHVVVRVPGVDFAALPTHVLGLGFRPQTHAALVAAIPMPPLAPSVGELRRFLEPCVASALQAVNGLFCPGKALDLGVQQGNVFPCEQQAWVFGFRQGHSQCDFHLG